MNTKSILRVLTATLLLALASFVGVACGPDTNGNNGGGLSPADAEEELFTLYGDAVCASMYRCPEQQNPNTLLFASRFESEEACSDNILGALGGGGGGTLSRDVEAGLTEWDEQKGRECIDAFEELFSDPCVSPFAGNIAPPEVCEEAIRGTQPNGAACDSSDHCQSGYCDRAVDTGDVCWGGECAEAPANQMLGEGADCSGQGQCDPAQDLVCESNPETQGSICVKKDSRTEGDPCRSADVCESGLACQQGTCVTLALGAQGDECDLQNTFCQPGLICHINSISQAGFDASCEAPIAQGEACFLDVSCKPGLHCEGADPENATEGSCEPALGEGGECDSNIDCEEGLSCGENDTCEAQEEEPYCEVPTEMMGS